MSSALQLRLRLASSGKQSLSPDNLRAVVRMAALEVGRLPPDASPAASTRQSRPSGPSLTRLRPPAGDGQGGRRPAGRERVGQAVAAGHGGSVLHGGAPHYRPPLSSAPPLRFTSQIRLRPARRGGWPAQSLIQELDELAARGVAPKPLTPEIQEAVDALASEVEAPAAALAGAQARGLAGGPPEAGADVAGALDGWCAWGKRLLKDAHQVGGGTLLPRTAAPSLRARPTPLWHMTPQQGVPGRSHIRI